MKKLSIIACMLLLSLPVAAQNWTLDKDHSSLSFEVSHFMISDVDGGFTSFDVSVNSSNEDFTNAKISFSADASSINTSNKKRDKHLRSPDFFDVEKYPSISFEGKSFVKKSDKNYLLKGDLTMHGIAKPVTLEVVLKGVTTDPFSKKRRIAAFKVTGKVKRSDFEIGKKTSSSIVGDEVNISANLALVN